MAVATSDFELTLRRVVVERKKPHPFEMLVSGGGATRQQVFCYLSQHYVFKREFPRFLAGIIANCPEPSIRAELAAILYEEETGKLSRSAPHPELWLRLCASAGFDARALRDSQPLPGTSAILSWLETATVRMSWLEGAAAVNIGLEALPPSTLEQLKRSRPGDFWLIRHYAQKTATPDLEFSRVHRELEEGHGDIGYVILAKHARTPEDQAKALAAINKTLDMWKVFNDSMAAAGR